MWASCVRHGLSVRSGRQHGTGDAGEVALQDEDLALVRSVEVGRVDVPGEVGHVHAAVVRIEGETDAFHEVGQQDLGGPLPFRRVHRRAVHTVAPRRVTAIRPVQHAPREVELQVDRLGQTVEQHLDVAAFGRTFPSGQVDSGAQDLPESRVARALLCPVEVSGDRVDGDSHAPLGLVAPVVLSLSRLYEGLDVVPVEVAAHDAHAFAITPVQLPARGLEV